VGKAGELRMLEDSKIIKLMERLKPAYKPGFRFRQLICLYTSGWMAKAGIHPLSAVKLIKLLWEEAGDRDPLKTRLSAVVYSYKKAGIDVDQWAREVEELTGVKPYGLEREIREEEVKGKSGLQEILEEVLGEEGALEVIREIEEILGVASPFRDAVFEILDYDRKIYAVVNFRRMEVVIARVKDGRVVYRNAVFIGTPVHVEVHASPLGDITKYKVVWEVPSRGVRITVGPAPFKEIYSRLRAEGLVKSKYRAKDVLAAILDGFVRKGRGVVYH